MNSFLYSAGQLPPKFVLRKCCNEKVTGLIFFAQGNRDDKVKYARFFEGQNLVYYKDITGKGEDYHLINPAHSR